MSESKSTRSDSGQTGWQPGLGARSEPTTGQSLIGPTVVIRGEITAEENLLIKGRIEGFIDHSQTVTIHTEGSVAAEVKAQEVLVEGTVHGNVYGTRRVQIAQTGNVDGNVYAPRVGVLEGASFKGAIDMDTDVDAIERRFREQTGTEMKSAPEKASAQEKDKEGQANAAQVEEKGSSDESASSDTAD